MLGGEVQERLEKKKVFLDDSIVPGWMYPYWLIVPELMDDHHSVAVHSWLSKMNRKKQNNPLLAHTHIKI
jgi:hypothetical protein